MKGLKPHRVKEAFMWGTEAADVYIDVEGYLEAKATSLSLHASQMRQRTPADRLERIQRGCARQGEEAGLIYAEGFRRVKVRHRFPGLEVAQLVILFAYFYPRRDTKSHDERICPRFGTNARMLTNG